MLAFALALLRHEVEEAATKIVSLATYPRSTPLETCACSRGSTTRVILGFNHHDTQYQEVGTSAAGYHVLSHATMSRAGILFSSMLALSDAMIPVRRQ
jgi:hypothetical protein